jgi:hypothetical protein
MGIELAAQVGGNVGAQGVDGDATLVVRFGEPQDLVRFGVGLGYVYGDYFNPTSSKPPDHTIPPGDLDTLIAGGGITLSDDAGEHDGARVTPGASTVTKGGHGVRVFFHAIWRLSERFGFGARAALTVTEATVRTGPASGTVIRGAEQGVSSECQGVLANTDFCRREAETTGEVTYVHKGSPQEEVIPLLRIDPAVLFVLYAPGNILRFYGGVTVPLPLPTHDGIGDMGILPRAMFSVELGGLLFGTDAPAGQRVIPVVE